MADHNPLISTKASDLDVTVSLHPLVLLTASDQITRHRVRGDEGPIAGILLGQQKGQEITAEHAFAAAFDKNESGQDIFRHDWLEERIQQYRDVHKAPALDVVGWFTLCSAAGPRPEFVPLQLQLNSINENSILLAIHPEAFELTQAVNQKLPISIYESVLELDTATTNARDESSMQLDDSNNEPASTDLKFRIVPYTVETDEAEMIAINYVAKGAGSAAAVAEQPQPQSHLQNNTLSENTVGDSLPKEEGTGTSTASKKGKKRSSPPAQESSKQEGAAAAAAAAAGDFGLPTPEEQDTISSIQTRLNSVKMLQSRIELLQKFITSLPPSYLSDASLPLTPDSPSPEHLAHLRNIQALLTRLSLLSSSECTTTKTTKTDNNNARTTRSETSLQAAAQSQANDVTITQLLSTLTHDVQALGELGKKFAVVESARGIRKRGGPGGAGPGGLGGPGGPAHWAYQGGGGASDDVDLRRFPPFGAGSSMVM